MTFQVPAPKILSPTTASRTHEFWAGGLPPASGTPAGPGRSPAAGAGTRIATVGEYDVYLVPREAAGDITPDAWDRLSEHSVHPNPFYERWSLVPALEHLAPSEEVLVVAGYRGPELAILFPVCVRRRYLKVWCFRDCMLTNVLQLPDVPLSPVLDTVMRRLHAVLMISPMHGEGAFAETLSHLCRFHRVRKAVTRFVDWADYEAGLSRKHRKENWRILRRLQEREGVRYVTAEVDLAGRWLPRYLEVEQASWKADCGATIAADPTKLAYFRDAIARGERQGKVQFQGLFKGEEAVAMSFRFTAQTHGYEVKTSYRKSYRQLYPGVSLELLNLRDILSGQNFSLVDSCSLENRVVQRIWPDEIRILNSVAFIDSVPGRIAWLLSRRFGIGRQQDAYCAG